MNQKQSKSDEMFFVVDQDDNPLDPLPRRLVHGRGVWHRVAHIWIVNDSGQILCQQRSFEKEVNPGLWEAFFGGHMAPGESYEMAAKRELAEEIGIEPPSDAFRLFKIFKFADPTGYNNEFQAIYVARWNGDESDVDFQDGEVARVEWKASEEIRDKLIHSRDSWTFCGYEFECLRFIERLGEGR